MNSEPNELHSIDPTVAQSSGARTLRMTLAYDGTNYCGWQVQPNGVAIQSVVQQALKEFTGEEIRVIASGRTDAGVHAIGQVVSFSTHSTAPCHGFLHGLPRYLPDDVVIREIETAQDDFNARYDAKRKWYRYVIHNSVIRVPFLRNAVLWQRSRLNHEAMHLGIQCLLGTHDFRCFESNWPNRSSSIRTIFHASVIRSVGWDVWNVSNSQVSLDHASHHAATKSEDKLQTVEPAFICIDVQADGFLYNMVRSIVGTLIHVGRGRWTPSDMHRILESGDRVHAGETAPPQGLYLMRVDY